MKSVRFIEIFNVMKYKYNIIINVFIISNYSICVQIPRNLIRNIKEKLNENCQWSLENFAKILHKSNQARLFVEAQN